MTRKVNMYVGYIDNLRTIHELTCIAVIVKRQSAAYEMPPLLKTGSNNLAFFLRDTVRHISSNRKSVLPLQLKYLEYYLQLFGRVLI